MSHDDPLLVTVMSQIALGLKEVISQMLLHLMLSSCWRICVWTFFCKSWLNWWEISKISINGPHVPVLLSILQVTRPWKPNPSSSDIPVIPLSDNCIKPSGCFSSSFILAGANINQGFVLPSQRNVWGGSRKTARLAWSIFEEALWNTCVYDSQVMRKVEQERRRWGH